MGVQSLIFLCSAYKNSCQPPHLRGWQFPARQNLVMGARVGSNFERRIRFVQPRDINDPRHWRNRAEEMRVLAKHMKDAETRRTMNRLADGWDKMADRAERRKA